MNAPISGTSSDNMIALFRLGFRPFFLGAGVFSIVSMASWMLLYDLQQDWIKTGLMPMQWHAHEMIYGYAMAVIAGFLLTAVRNWTGIQTVHSVPLAALWLCWLVARLGNLIADPLWLKLSMIVDSLFGLFLCVALTYPIVQKKRWKDMGLVSKVYLLLVGNLVFYLGVMENSPEQVRLGIFAGLYLVIAIILTLGRRVIPFFIQAGVGYPVQPVNRLWVDRTSLVLFLMFAIVEIFQLSAWLAAVLALSLFVVHLWRLQGWHTPGIWKQPMLWVLYLAYAWLVVGFGLFFLSYVLDLPVFPAIHAFAFGGIGMMTVGMMARVSLGHTGRNVLQPPAGMGAAFMLLAAGAGIRVLFPLLFSAQYMLWIGLSQLAWLAAFGIFVSRYASILIRPRVDGRWG